jgi:maltoporin
MPFTARKNQDILKGSKLMVFLGGAPIGMATSHSMSMTTDTSEISTKDHGDFPSVVAQKISWEVSCENLYTVVGKDIYMTAMKSMQPVTLVFAEAGNYSNETSQGATPMESEDQTVVSAEWTIGNRIGEGKALITSFSINAPAGDNATMSVTFTGTGELKTSFT